MEFDPQIRRAGKRKVRILTHIKWALQPRQCNPSSPPTSLIRHEEPFAHLLIPAKQQKWKTWLKVQPMLLSELCIVGKSCLICGRRIQKQLNTATSRPYLSNSCKHCSWTCKKVCDTLLAGFIEIALKCAWSQCSDRFLFDFMQVMKNQEETHSLETSSVQSVSETRKQRRTEENLPVSLKDEKTDTIL